MIHETSPIRRWKQWLALPLVAVSLFTVACGHNTETVAPTEKETAETIKVKRLSDGALVDMSLPPPPPPAPVAPDAPPVQEPKVYTYVEQMPRLPGGGNVKAIVEYLQTHIKYSDALKANPKEGTVYVSFTVLENGEVKGVKTIKGLSPEYDAAVMDAVQTLPRFIPGKQNNKPVAVSFTVPVRFVR